LGSAKIPKSISISIGWTRKALLAPVCDRVRRKFGVVILRSRALLEPGAGDGGGFDVVVVMVRQHCRYHVHQRLRGLRILVYPGMAVAEFM
jgi:hypothetical protein